eukprot:c27512_g1_i1 orf=128-322(+)
MCREIILFWAMLFWNCRLWTPFQSFPLKLPSSSFLGLLILYTLDSRVTGRTTDTICNFHSIFYP